MTDIHCHIIPGVDDGARDLEESLALVKMEASGGTSAFVATPHVIEKADYSRLDLFAERAELLRNALSNEGVVVSIVQGAEVYPSSKMIEALDAGLPITVGGSGRHMLLDLPLTAFPHDFDSLLYEVQARRITPILAHPERSARFQEQPDLVRAYREKGILIQVNAASLRGRYGPRAQEVAVIILKSHWANFVASDAHRPGKGPILGGARLRLTELVGAEYAEFLTAASPDALVCGNEAPEAPIAPPLARGFFARLLHRS